MRKWRHDVGRQSAVADQRPAVLGVAVLGHGRGVFGPWVGQAGRVVIGLYLLACGPYLSGNKNCEKPNVKDMIPLLEKNSNNMVKVWIKCETLSYHNFNP
jgi:hypothetical protein